MLTWQIAFVLFSEWPNIWKIYKLSENNLNWVKINTPYILVENDLTPYLHVWQHIRSR